LSRKGLGGWSGVSKSLAETFIVPEGRGSVKTTKVDMVLRAWHEPATGDAEAAGALIFVPSITHAQCSQTVIHYL
jgi:hypothetical protein